MCRVDDAVLSSDKSRIVEIRAVFSGGEDVRLEAGDGRHRVAFRADAPAENETVFNVGALNGKIASLQGCVKSLEAGVEKTEARNR